MLKPPKEKQIRYEGNLPESQKDREVGEREGTRSEKQGQKALGKCKFKGKKRAPLKKPQAHWQGGRRGGRLWILIPEKSKEKRKSSAKKRLFGTWGRDEDNGRAGRRREGEIFGGKDRQEKRKNPKKKRGPVTEGI